MKFGIDRLLEEPQLQRKLRGRKTAFLGHSASVTEDGRYSLDALMQCEELQITAVFAPQHGFYGEKQDNMIESEDFVHPRYGFPVFSLYGKVRRPTPEMLAVFEVLLVDLQDAGARVYTYTTTLFYMLEACAASGKEVWVLDRPNPAGRPEEGSLLRPGWESFVGAAPLVMRHGMTFGELARWYTEEKKLAVNLKIIAMEGYDPLAVPGYGWPLFERSWVNPSPNIPAVSTVRSYPGTVLIEGTTLSEGRGTTIPFEVIGAPGIDPLRILKKMEVTRPEWMEGAVILPYHFEPVFDKHSGSFCAGIRILTDNRHYRHDRFRPYRLTALFLKAMREEYPGMELWRDIPFEYETDRLPIDLLSGSPFLREWVDDDHVMPDDLEAYLAEDEKTWREIREPYLIY
jgi:uncharacterized protein YbbC (DUF1343 family)